MKPILIAFMLTSCLFASVDQPLNPHIERDIKHLFLRVRADLASRNWTQESSGLDVVNQSYEQLKTVVAGNNDPRDVRDAIAHLCGDLVMYDSMIGRSGK